MKLLTVVLRKKTTRTAPLISLFVLSVIFCAVVSGLGFFKDFSTPKVQAEVSQTSGSAGSTGISGKQTVFTFLRDLREGDSGEDVRQLQKILNSELLTTNSETFFGPDTKKAVILFQNKYAAEILTPVGLTQGSGFVGAWTRLKLNRILSKNALTSTIPPSLQNSAPNTSSLGAFGSLGQFVQLSALGPGNSNELVINFPSLYYGPVGTEVTLSGSGFSTKSNSPNMIYFGKNKIENVVAKSATEITFTIPQDFSAGRHDISISNSSFKKHSNTVGFMITKPGAPLPVIEKIEPAEAKFGEKIKITGRNFTAKDNIVSTNLGIFRGIQSSDGTTITFSIPLPSYFGNSTAKLRSIWFDGKDNLHWPIWIRVANVNGISGNPESSKFIINI